VKESESEAVSVERGGDNVTSVFVLGAEGSSNTRLHSRAAPRARHGRAHDVAIALGVQVQTAMGGDVGRR